MIGLEPSVGTGPVPSQFSTDSIASVARTSLRESIISTPSGAAPAKEGRFISFVRGWRPLSGMWNDIRSRALFYVSDWTDAWNYRVVPATTVIFFANILPGIAFSLDLIETTAQYGVTEVLLSTFMAAFVFSMLGGQPLCIAGVTGPITVFNRTIYIILEGRPDSPNYLFFIGWVYLWSAIMHWVLAVFNGKHSTCNFLQYVTLFSCDTFGFYVSWVYLQYGVQVITRQFGGLSSTSTPEGPYVSIILALLVLVTAHLFIALSKTTLFHRLVRRFLSDYGMPITVVAGTAAAHWGRFNTSHPTTLPIAGAFEPANGRAWLVEFWQLEGKWVGVAFPFGIILTILFLFDHNVSSLIAQGSQFPLRKPPGFHWDLFLLGVTTFIAGLLGIPAPNGLIPQAPIHTQSLVVLGHRKGEDEEHGSEAEKPHHSTLDGQPIAVIEQRVSNLIQGSLCLVLMTGPFLHVLHLVPRGVLAGLFWYMGSAALQTSGITAKMLFLLRDPTLADTNDPLHKVRKSRIALFVIIQLLGFGATMAITQTIAAVGFPVIIILLIPLRMFVIPRLPFTHDELAILDGPTASAFTMASVGGSASFSRRK
ncbi:hypothetical protein BS47DRAFT_1441482 [Hydnum rufescens UP504]|uniref:Bicarbonate transporter-like transmembrane domain-containing protein n=1 Tax=Hydnum rufescens UP504 TaxID=1448309 RepID=A0A9P6B3Y7_9AGAM|nr:hypothetical protein BS47DRAFT_1441482 [Hydnum rufescens UP504]